MCYWGSCATHTLTITASHRTTKLHGYWFQWFRWFQRWRYASHSGVKFLADLYVDDQKSEHGNSCILSSGMGGQEKENPPNTASHASYPLQLREALTELLEYISLQHNWAKRTNQKKRLTMQANIVPVSITARWRWERKGMSTKWFMRTYFRYDDIYYLEEYVK